MCKRKRKERRKHPRGNFYYLIKYKTPGGKESIVSSSNISAGGALLRLKKKCEIGQLIGIVVNFLTPPCQIPLEAKVVRVKKQKNFYLTAVELTKINPRDKKAIDDFIKGSRKNA